MNPFFITVVVFLVLTIVLVGFVLWRTSRRGFSHATHIFIARSWDDVRALESRDPKSAIMEADKLLDYALTQLRYRGTLGDKLKESGKLFRDLNGIWSAHKLRNSIAHEMQFVPSPREVKIALSQFEQGLKDLKAL